MTNHRVIAKRFSWYKQKLGNWIILGYFILALSCFTILKPYLDPALPISNLRLSIGSGLTKLVIEDTSNSQKLNLSSSQPSVSGGEAILKQGRKPICNFSDPIFDFCDVKGDVRIHGKSYTIFAASSHRSTSEGNESWFIKPYPRKSDQDAMRFVKGFSVKAIVGDDEEAPFCTVNHNVPAIVFSAGGYSGNHFHSFNDVIVPLFATAAQFHGEVRFLVTNLANYWSIKFKAILEQLSKYEIINIDHSDDKVHCFPRIIVGLKYYKELRVDPLTSSNGYSIKMFRQLVANAYSLKKSTAIKIGPQTQEKPRLLIIARKRTRSFMNVDEIAEMAKSLGFEVVVSEGMKNLYEFSHVVNSCDVMLGVHGAGLTNLVFLPTNAVLIQVLPWGGFEWLASNSFGKAALEMDLRYMEYKVKAEESSLLQEYPLDHPVIKDPSSVHKHNFQLFKAIYLNKQNVKIDVGRFRATLLEALDLLHY